MNREVIDDESDIVAVDRGCGPEGAGVGWVILVILVSLLVLWLLLGGIFKDGAWAPARDDAGNVNVNIQIPPGDTQ